jgi:hypothetical protein
VSSTRRVLVLGCGAFLTIGFNVAQHCPVLIEDREEFALYALYYYTVPTN